MSKGAFGLAAADFFGAAAVFLGADFAVALDVVLDFGVVAALEVAVRDFLDAAAVVVFGFDTDNRLLGAALAGVLLLLVVATSFLTGFLTVFLTGGAFFTALDVVGAVLLDGVALLTLVEAAGLAGAALTDFRLANPGLLAAALALVRDGVLAAFALATDAEDFTI